MSEEMQSLIGFLIGVPIGLGIFFLLMALGLIQRLEDWLHCPATRSAYEKCSLIRGHPGQHRSYLGERWVR